MNFGFSEEQELLRSEVRRFLDERCPLPEVRRLKETDLGFSEELWAEMARRKPALRFRPEPWSRSGWKKTVSPGSISR